MWLLICSATLIFSVVEALPPGWKTCPRSSPDFLECLKKDILTALVDLRDGNEELGVSPLEPYFHPKTKIEMAPGFEMGMTNTSMYGLTKGRIDKLELDGWKLLKVWMYNKNMNYTFIYNFKGKFLNFDVDSSGDAFVNLDDVYTEVNVTFDEFIKSGKTYLKVKDLSMHYTLGGAHVHLEPHRKNNKFVDAINQLINQNWRTLYALSEKSGDDVLGHIIWNVIDHVLERIPLEEFNIP